MGIFQARILEWVAISFSNIPQPGPTAPRLALWGPMHAAAGPSPSGHGHVSSTTGSRAASGPASIVRAPFSVFAASPPPFSQSREIGYYLPGLSVGLRTPVQAGESVPQRQPCACAKLLQSCLTLCDPVDCSPPGSSVHGDSLGNNTGVGCQALLQGLPGDGLRASQDP